MGMDVSGKAPTKEVGEYFRNNVWWWRPLADYLRVVAPELMAKVTNLDTNDGDGLDAEDSIKLADILDQQLDDGHTRTYAQSYEEWVSGLPRQKCDFCAGTGIRTDEVGIAYGFPNRIVAEPADNPRLGQEGWCNACHGAGTREDFRANYPFSVKNVKEFAQFVRYSGGFEIW